MKTKLSFLLLILALSSAPCALSQIPQGFNYQAVAKNASGLPIINQTLPVRMTIQSDSLGGTIFWQELHSSVITTDQGVINLNIGRGARQSSSTVAKFSAIDWGVPTKFLKIEIDYSGWKTLGVSRLWSVPYAMVAGDLAGSIKSLAVEGETSSLEEALFEVKNKDGQIVFAVYNEGVRVYVSDGAKAVKGGFAVGGFGTDKSESTKYLFVGKDSVRIYLDTNPLTKKLKGGFAVGGYDLTKGTVQDYLDVNPDSVRIYIDSNPETKKIKGGFAVGGYDMTKGTSTNYMNVNTDASGIVNPSQNRILWYPLKNAFLTGKVLIESSVNVGENSFTSGFESKAKGNWSQALGFKAIANGDYSTAIGKNAVASNANSFAFGDGSSAQKNDSYSFGAGAIASGKGSYAFGSAGRDTLGNLTGLMTTASGDYSFAIGQGSRSTGITSISLGSNVLASGKSSTAIGYYSSASGTYSTSIGSFTNANGWFSNAMGSYTIAAGENSTAMGFSTSAREAYSTAMGFLSRAHGTYSTAMGCWTEASGTYSVTMGYSSIASGTASTATGSSTTASGNYSTAMGNSTTASGNYSTTIGANTLAPSGYEFVAGRYNTTYTPLSTTGWNSSDRIFVIGNGTGSSLRSDALTILKNGNTGIGTSSPGYKLTVNGTAWCTSGAWSGSDVRWKKNIVPVLEILKDIVKLTAVNFEWRTEEFPELGFEDGLQTGLIAQEVEDVFPELVKTDENGYKAISYEKLSVVLVEAVKEQQYHIESYKSENDNLKSQFQMLQEKVEKIEALLFGGEIK